MAYEIFDDSSNAPQARSTRPPEAQWGVPTVTCPECGAHMRLASIVSQTRTRETMTFDCLCAFKYQQSFAAAPGRSRATRS